MFEKTDSKALQKYGNRRLFWQRKSYRSRVNIGECFQTRQNYSRS